MARPRTRREIDVTHFITLTFWENLEAIRGFSGEDVEKAKYYPQDADFLLEYESRVVHYEVVGRSSTCIGNHLKWITHESRS